MMYPQPAFNHDHRFVVVNTRRQTWVEGAYTYQAASRSVTVLNNHEQRNGRPPVYAYIEVSEEEMRAFIKAGCRHPSNMLEK